MYWRFVLESQWRNTRFAWFSTLIIIVKLRPHSKEENASSFLLPIKCEFGWGTNFLRLCWEICCNRVKLLKIEPVLYLETGIFLCLNHWFINSFLYSFVHQLICKFNKLLSMFFIIFALHCYFNIFLLKSVIIGSIGRSTSLMNWSNLRNDTPINSLESQKTVDASPPESRPF